MSVPAAASQSERAATIPNPSELVEQTREFAARIYEAVAAQYLRFRQEFYHEAEPSLATVPPAHAEIRQAEVARLAESILRLVPQAIKSIPLVGGFLDHLEQVADIHSISEDERTALHNMTLAFLHGINGGIQPWYVEWLLASAHNLSQVRHAEYYMEYPWDGLLYMPPAALAAFDEAVRTGDIEAIKREIDHLGGRLIEVLRDPVHTQPELAFTGPDSERRRFLFNLRTAAALALLTYLIAEEVRSLTRPRRAGPPPSALAPLPPQLSERVIPHDAR
jgi:hypothetical protein